MRSGLFVPLDVNFAEDDRVLGLTVEAEAVFVRSLLLAKRRASDGFIARVQLRLLCDRCLTAPDDLAAELVDAGLWQVLSGGWVIPSFLDHNDSAAQIEAKREAEKQRKADYRKRRKSVPKDATECPDGTRQVVPWDATSRDTRRAEHSRAEQSREEQSTALPPVRINAERTRTPEDVFTKGIGNCRDFLTARPMR